MWVDVLKFVTGTILIAIAYLVIVKLHQGLPGRLAVTITCTAACSYQAYRMNVWYHGWERIDIVPVSIVTIICFVLFLFGREAAEVLVDRSPLTPASVRGTINGFVRPSGKPTYNKTANKVPVKGTGWVKVK